MSKRGEYKARTEEFPLPLMEERKSKLVDAEYVKEAETWYPQVYIDKEGGIIVDDCEVINRKLSEWLDAKDFTTDSYILEVSSLGLGRPFKKDKDLERNIGREVDIKLHRVMGKQKDSTEILKPYDKVRVTIEQEDNMERIFTRSDIALIRLVFDFQAICLVERIIGG